MQILKGKKVFITGAASGIGRATAIAMGKLECSLFLTDINGDGLKNTVDVISNAGGRVCLARSFDVGHYQSMAEFAKKVHDGYGSLDILINVAGVALFFSDRRYAAQRLGKSNQRKSLGVIHGLECFVPEMIRAGMAGILYPFHLQRALSDFPGM